MSDDLEVDPPDEGEVDTDDEAEDVDLDQEIGGSEETDPDADLEEEPEGDPATERLLLENQLREITEERDQALAELSTASQAVDALHEEQTRALASLSGEVAEAIAERDAAYAARDAALDQLASFKRGQWFGIGVVYPDGQTGTTYALAGSASEAIARAEALGLTVTMHKVIDKTPLW